MSDQPNFYICTLIKEENNIINIDNDIGIQIINKNQYEQNTNDEKVFGEEFLNALEKGKNSSIYFKETNNEIFCCRKMEIITGSVSINSEPENTIPGNVSITNQENTIPGSVSINDPNQNEKEKMQKSQELDIISGSISAIIAAEIDKKI